MKVCYRVILKRETVGDMFTLSIAKVTLNSLNNIIFTRDEKLEYFAGRKAECYIRTK